MQWIKDIDNEYKDYKIFQSQKNKILKSVIIYIDNNNEIIHITKDKSTLQKENLVSKDELINLLINKKKYNNIIYNDYKIMKFNPNISVNDLENFMETSNLDTTSYTDTYKNISDIYFKDSMFDDLNTIFIILKQRTAPSKFTRHVKCDMKKIKKKTRKYLNITKE